jgi:hypothetical protein
MDGCDTHVRSDALNLGEVTRFLVVQATSGFESGAPYIGKAKIAKKISAVERHRPSFGVWHFNTSHFMHDESFQAHALLLLEIDSPQRLTVRRARTKLTSSYCVEENAHASPMETTGCPGRSIVLE